MLKWVETDCGQQEIPALGTNQLAGEGDKYFPLKLLFKQTNKLTN